MSHQHTNTLKKITCWSFYNKKEEIYEHSHFETGWVTTEPIPKSIPQKSWKTRYWKFSHEFLDVSVFPNKVLK